MTTNLFRQLKDIIVQAEKISKSKPSLEDIEAFRRYSAEMKSYLLENIKDEMVIDLVLAIPDIKKNEFMDAKDLWFLLRKGPLRFWYQKQKYINEAKKDIEISRGKYSSIVFILK